MLLPPRSLVRSIALTSATIANAQQAPDNPESTTLRSCVAHAEHRNVDSTLVIGKRAEAIFRQRIAANAPDTDALVGLARILSQCFLPSASFMTQGQLSSDAMELLDNAIDVDPNYWMARFTLASIAYRFSSRRKPTPALATAAGISRCA
ncbi:MAG: hypothetical protein ACT4P6_19100 [Gemmatimonadaceae bacterium]